MLLFYHIWQLEDFWKYTQGCKAKEYVQNTKSPHTSSLNSLVCIKYMQQNMHLIITFLTTMFPASSTKEIQTQNLSGIFTLYTMCTQFYQTSLYSHLSISTSRYWLSHSNLCPPTVWLEPDTLNSTEIFLKNYTLYHMCPIVLYSSTQSVSESHYNTCMYVLTGICYTHYSHSWSKI